MRRAGALLGVLALAGCASYTPPRMLAPACPEGQAHLRTAQLFLGGPMAGGAVPETEISRFVDQEITPRFPDGVTVLAGGGQWRGAENRLIREAQKVVLIVLPPDRAAQAKLDQVRQAYKARFAQDTVLVVTQPACVAF